MAHEKLKCNLAKAELIPFLLKCAPTPQSLAHYLLTSFSVKNLVYHLPSYSPSSNSNHKTPVEGLLHPCQALF